MNPPIDHPKYARMLEIECIDHAGCIIGEPCDVERFPIVSRATDPAVVDEDQLVRRRETINERRLPIGGGRGKAVQNEQRQAIPNTTIGNLCTIDLDCSRWLTGHGRRQEITSRASKSTLCASDNPLASTVRCAWSLPTAKTREHQ